MKRTHIYRISAILLPFIILLIIEGILQLSNYGYTTSLFITDPYNPEYMVMNRDISRKYFSITANATIGNQEPFRKKKQANTLRFFVLGASSSLGFPYMHNGTFPRMLKYKLQFEYPRYNIEIINLSLTAINSYTLYDFSRELINYQPDGILIYAGHNEYYGALGVASSSKAGDTPRLIDLLIKSKESKLIQALARLQEKWNVPDSALTNPQHTLMDRMAANQIIPLNSEKFHKGIQQFEYNLSRILRLFSDHDIPVFIGTLAANIKDQAPLEKGNETADELYKNGQNSYIQQDFKQAEREFIAAKENDGIRFRAPEAFNTIIRKLAGSVNNVYLVDVSQYLKEHSPYGMIGKEFLLEHVHPNLTGHRLIAESYYEELQKHFFKNKSKQNGFCVDLEDYPTTAFDTIYGELVIYQLKQEWPFYEKELTLACDTSCFEFKTAIRYIHKKLNWGEAMQRLNNYYILHNNYEKALRIVEQMCLELPYEKAFYQQAGMLSRRLHLEQKSEYYLKHLNNE